MARMTNGQHNVALADVLFRTIKQMGVSSIHGLPGDYNLTLLDYIEPNGLKWVGSVNELNAGYAADGYARIKGIGALITTYGVGELSAINAIAGAFTERAPVIHIVGTPPRDAARQRKNIHHTLGDGEYRHFAQMASHVTVAQVALDDPRTCVERLQYALKQCLIHSRPVYIEVPVDMVSVPVVNDTSALEVPSVPQYLPDAMHEKVVSAILDKISSAKQPTILIDNDSRSLRLVSELDRLVKLTKWTTFTSASGRGLVDNTLPNVFGVYKGEYSDAKTQDYLKSSDLVLCFGPHFSNTNTYRMSTVPDPSKTISFEHFGITVCGDPYRDVEPRQALAEVCQQLQSSSNNSNERDAVDLSRETALSFADVELSGPLKQDTVWKLCANFLRPGDIIFGETGTAAYGVREMPLPQHVSFFTATTWLSIGYMLPAAQGAALAQRELAEAGQYHEIRNPRTVLFIGDGSLQLTVQELATIVGHNLNVVVFVINNDGYTIERCIHGRDQDYNNISRWRYLQAPSLFGAPEDTFTASVRTYDELQKALGDERLSNGKGLRMVELVLDRLDVPPGLLMDMMRMQDKDVVKEVVAAK